MIIEDSPAKSVSVSQVIVCTFVVGNGTEIDPKRIVMEYYALDGSYLGKTDPKYPPYSKD